MDALTDLFKEMYAYGEVVSRFDLNAPWGITMPPQGGIFHAVEQGECWVRSASDGGLIKLSAGDLVIFPEGASHDIVDSPPSLATPLEDALCGMVEDTLISHLGGSGPQTRFICGVFHFQEGGRFALSSLLPPVMLVRGGPGTATQWLQLTFQRLSEEAALASPGAHTVISRLTDVLFIEGVRAWLNSEEGETLGWIGVLKDPVVASALKHVHVDPARDWTVASLAAEVGLSRSAFAAHFTRLVGEPPLQYLTSWRMQLARNWLHRTNMGLAEIAERLGYSSEDAFKRAFKREVGVAPGFYRKSAEVGALAA